MSLFTPDTKALPNYEDKGKFIMAWRFSLVFSIVFFGLTFFMIQNSITGASLYAITSCIAAGTLFYMKFTRKYYIVFLIYAIAGTVFSHYSLFMVQNVVHYGDILWIMTIVLFAFIALGKQAGWIFLFINIIGVVLFMLFGTHVDFSETVNPFASKVSIAIELATVFLIMAYLVNQYLKFQNYAQEQLALLNTNLEHRNEEILSQNRENITLIKEVHHRVKNNLQIIISLLRMQRSEMSSEEAREQFSVAINRILTMSLIHQKLYQEKEASRIDIYEYIIDLSNEIIGVTNKPLRLEVDAKEQFAGLRTIVPFGLLLNELMSNSAKHAFKEDEIGVIHIEISKEDNHQMNFTYSDNGTWVEPDENGTGFGLELIDTLTEQLDGTYSREGSTYHFKLSVVD